MQDYHLGLQAFPFTFVLIPIIIGRMLKNREDKLNESWCQIHHQKLCYGRDIS